jgi:polar amino acid transport system substrate-binding protein
MGKVTRAGARLGATAMITVGLIAGLAACGGSDGGGGTGTGSATGSTGTTSSKEALTMAADPALLPYNFYGENGKAWQGINVDLAAALSEELGREITIKPAPFDSIIPGLQAGRFDFALTGMFDTKDRQKQIDFVDYLKSKNNFLVRSDDDLQINTLDDLCGTHVGQAKGAFEIQVVEDQSKACEKDGKKPIQLDVFPDLNATTLALIGGRVDVVLNDSAANAYLVRENDGKVKAGGDYLSEGYFALGVPKGDALLEEFQQGFQALQDSGKLEEIFDKWGIADRMPEKITINNAVF